MTTIQGELVPRTDGVTGNARRTQKIYEDILGRQFKTEAYNWDSSTVYSTVVNSYNGRDQAVLTRQYAGADTSSTYQDTTATFDGHGRLASTHKPEQRDSSDNLTYTTYSYNADDSIHTVTDGREAITTYTYGYQDDSSSSEKRGLLTKTAYSVPTGSGITDPSDVTYAYDNLGNRTQMTDGMGNTVYAYDSLSEMTSETRQFNDTLANAPMSSNRFQITYGYAISGQLKTYTDPYGQQVNYVSDRLGRPTSVTGSSFGGVTSYADSVSYRAWGGMKETNYASGLHLAVAYNDRLKTSSYDLEDPNQDAILNKSYSYFTDGKLKYIQDIVDGRFDRLNSYDNMGRVKDGKSGAEARGGTVSTPDQPFHLPYRQSYSFDPFGHLTESNNLHWGVSTWNGQSFDQTYGYTNNRIQDTGWALDMDGRNTEANTGTDDVLRSYNAAGKLIETVSSAADSTSDYDGGGLEVKRALELYDDQTSTWVAQPTKYYIRSSVMKGRVVSEVLSNGKKYRTYIKGVGGETAVQQAYATETATLDELVMFEFSDASGMSYRTTDKVGVAAATGDGGEGSPIEIDPLGGSVGMFTPYITLSGGAYTPRYPDLIQPYDVSEPSGPDFSSLYATFGGRTADLPGFGTNWGSFAAIHDQEMDERWTNLSQGVGFLTFEEISAWMNAYTAAQTAAGITGGHESVHAAGDPVAPIDPATGSTEGQDSSTLVSRTLAGLIDSSVTVSPDRNLSFGMALVSADSSIFINNSFEKALMKAFERARVILTKDPGSKCAKFFGPNAISALNEMREKAKVVSKTDKPGATDTGIEQTYSEDVKGLYGKYRVPATFSVFMNGPFFAGGKGSIGSYAAGSYAAQNSAILHELAHNIIMDGKYLILNDGGDSSQSSTNTTTIIANCGDEIFDVKKATIP